ncbi:MAG: type IX secretion system sortase PorU [Cyclobacteriaceae bacterium]
MRPALLKTIFLVFCSLAALSQPGVLKQGKWMKVSVREPGIYKIDYNLLSRLASPAGINPQTIKLYAYPTGMLPQPNSTERQKGLKEIAIEVTGAADGKFDRGDKIIFFGEGPDLISFDKTKGVYKIENNLYDDYNHYFLTFGGAPGKRVSPAIIPTGTPVQISTFRDYFYSETDKTNILKSGRDWFGIDFDANTEALLTWETSGMQTNSEVKLITRLMAASYQNASFKVEFNGSTVGNYPIAAIPQTSYGAKGRTRNDTATFNFTGNISGKQIIKLTYDRGGNNYSIGRLDYLIAVYERELAFTGKPGIFYNTNAVPGVNEINIRSQSDAVVWEITDPFKALLRQATFSNNLIGFKTEGDQIKRFVIFSPENSIPLPDAYKVIGNQDLSDLPDSKMIIITHPLFLDQAARLASHRSGYSGISTSVVTTDQIYNEFSGGRQDPTAIRDFLRDRYRAYSGNLKYALLFGKGTYDYRNITGPNSTFVPIYQSYNSLSPLETYSSDDYFAFLEDNEGSWLESPAQFHTLDIGIGRIPCTTEEQAINITDKIISYETSPQTEGLWKRNIVFVADDGDGNIHQSQAAQLSALVEQKRPELLTSKLFLDLFEQQDKPFGQISPDASDALFRKFHEGAAIINFTGHGSEQLWMAERILDPERIASLTNRFRLPFLVTATCEFGRTDDPALQSAAEQVILKRASGAIGLVTSSRPVSSATNFELNNDLYNALLPNEASAATPLGDMFKATKNASDTRIGNRNFILLGDPSMNLALPKPGIRVTEISSAAEGSIGGLEEIVVNGEVTNGESVATDYQGTVTMELYDRPVSVTTLGDENEPFGYEEWQRVLFRGSATVSNGTFSFRFRTPSSDRTLPSAGKILLHATATDRKQDVAGAEIPVNLSTVNYTLSDNTAPRIQLWMNDTTFVAGGTAGKNPVLLAKIADGNGIDLSMKPDRRITITLDDNKTFFAEPYYTAINGTVTGMLYFQFFDLEEGLHTVTLKAYDLNGNEGSQFIQFTVDGGGIEINFAGSFPNPFTTSTSLFIDHNRPGDDLTGSLIITDRMGSQIRKIEFEQALATERVIITDWDGTDAAGNKLPSGLYFIKVEVRSVLYGSKSVRSGKVILLN